MHIDANTDARHAGGVPSARADRSGLFALCSRASCGTRLAQIRQVEWGNSILYSMFVEPLRAITYGMAEEGEDLGHGYALGEYGRMGASARRQAVTALASHMKELSAHPDWLPSVAEAADHLLYLAGAIDGLLSHVAVREVVFGAGWVNDAGTWRMSRRAQRRWQSRPHPGSAAGKVPRFRRDPNAKVLAYFAEQARLEGVRLSNRRHPDYHPKNWAVLPLTLPQAVICPYSACGLRQLLDADRLRLSPLPAEPWGTDDRATEWVLAEHWPDPGRGGLV